MNRVVPVLAVTILCLSFVFAQEDSIVVLSVRVGRFIDNQERAYFNFLATLPDTESVYFVRRTIDGKERVTLTSLHGAQRQVAVDSSMLMQYANLMEGREKTTEKRETGKIGRVKLRSSVVHTGEFVFADIHGVVLRDSLERVIVRGDLVSVETDDEFGRGVVVGMASGTLLGVLIYGIGGVSGTDIEAGMAVSLTLVFTGTGGLAGLIYDAIVAAGGTSGTLLEEGDPWDTTVAERIQRIARFPAGTPELKAALGRLDQD